MSNEPFIICGAHGGGTSFITKLLRLNGFFSGHDCCPIDDRKTHESKSLNMVNRKIISLMSISGKYESGRTNDVIYEYERFFSNNSEMNNIIKLKIIEIINNFDFSDYWGEYNSENIKIWGWKDPRNSITLPFWQKKFPNARILCVAKKKDKNGSKSDSGNWFKNEALDSVIEFYQQPRGVINHNNLYIIDFEKTLSSLSEFNNLLTFCRLPKINNNSDFNALLSNAKFETPNS